MTKEQEILVEKYYAYALKVARKTKGRDREQIVSDSLFYLCKLVENYDKDRSQIGTYLCKYLPLIVNQTTVKRETSLKRKAIDETLSLDEEHFGEYTVLESIAQDTFIEPNELELDGISKDIMNVCTKKQKVLIQLILDGCKPCDASEKLGVSKQAVSDMLKSIRKRVLTHNLV